MSELYLLLDFDGVLADSTAECFVVATLAWQVYTRGVDPNSLSIAETAAAFSVARHGPEWEYFARHRALVRWPREYRVVLCGWLTGRDLSQGDFDAAESAPRKEQDAFQEVFLGCRSVLARRHFSEWIGLYRPYTSVIQTASTLAEQLPTFLLTGRDRQSVLAVLNSAGWYPDPDRVLDATRFRNKEDALMSLRSRHPAARFAMLDDNIEHLLLLSEKGVHCYWATWGYIHPVHWTRFHAPNSVTPVQMDDWHTELARLRTREGA